MDSNEAKTVHVSGPGQTLRQARSDLRLSPEDVAHQLHLAPRQILALEADDYEHLPQATYVRGYLRSYALFLGLTPEPILDAYTRATAGRVPVKRPRELQMPGPAGGEHEGQSKFGPVAVGALILLLVIAWWQGREDKGASDAPATTASAPPDSAMPVPPATGTAPPTSASDPLAAGGNATAPAVQIPNTNAPPETSAPPATAAVAPATPPPEAKPKPRVPANARQARLVVNATAESWVDVRDARGERLLYETVPAGRIVGLEGLAPFRVFLGNAAGVSVAIDGEAFDVSRYQRGTTARFTLNPQTAPATPASPPPTPPAPTEPTAPAAQSPAPLLPE